MGDEIASGVDAFGDGVEAQALRSTAEEITSAERRRGIREVLGRECEGGIRPNHVRRQEEAIEKVYSNCMTREPTPTSSMRV